jgi:hypothetical protein
MDMKGRTDATPAPAFKEKTMKNRKKMRGDRTGPK